MRTLSRRNLLATAAAATAAPAAAADPATPKPSLNDAARRKGRRFGSAIAAGWPGRTDGGTIGNPDYAAVVSGECGLIVPENEMKMQAIRPDEATFAFGPADRIVAFADRHGLDVRGHNLIWHKTKWLPDWVNSYDFGSRPATAAEKLIVTHVTTVCRHFGERIRSWDVVNEAVDPATGEVRQTALSRHLGDRMIDIAFQAAREALPHCQLVYNDYMEWEAGNDRHRSGVLRLLERLKRDGVPVDALGLQSHIGGDSDDTGPAQRAQPEAWARFLHGATGMGLDLLVAELDVNDRALPADPAVRDRAVADLVRRYLDVTLSFPQMGDVLCWGMADRFSWLQSRSPRADNLAKRPCPYDDALRPKPMRQAIARSLRAAAPHPSA